MALVGPGMLGHPGHPGPLGHPAGHPGWGHPGWGGGAVRLLDPAEKQTVNHVYTEGLGYDFVVVHAYPMELPNGMVTQVPEGFLFGAPVDYMPGENAPEIWGAHSWLYCTHSAMGNELTKDVADGVLLHLYGDAGMYGGHPMGDYYAAALNDPILAPYLDPRRWIEAFNSGPRFIEESHDPRRTHGLAPGATNDPACLHTTGPLGAHPAYAGLGGPAFPALEGPLGFDPAFDGPVGPPIAGPPGPSYMPGSVAAIPHGVRVKKTKKMKYQFPAIAGGVPVAY